MRIYIVRHGESYSNTGGRMMSTTDSPLTEKGIHQSEAARDYLQEIIFDHIFASPLIRAKRTAEIICGDEGKIEICDNLKEMHLGKLEGLTWEERHRRFRDIDIEGGLSRAQMPEGESFEDLVSRCNTFIKEKLDAIEKDKNILIVSHGITKRVLINELLGKPRHYADHINWADNTAISEIDRSEKTLIRLNDRKHIVDLGIANSNYEEWGLFSSQDYTQL